VVASLVLGLLLIERIRATAASALAREQERTPVATSSRERRTGGRSRALASSTSASSAGAAGRAVHDRHRPLQVRSTTASGTTSATTCSSRCRTAPARLRGIDVVARWGGEEITVLAPGIRSRRGLEQFSERIRRLIGDEPLDAGRTASRHRLGRWDVDSTARSRRARRSGALTRRCTRRSAAGQLGRHAPTPPDAAPRERVAPSSAQACGERCPVRQQ